MNEENKLKVKIVGGMQIALVVLAVISAVLTFVPSINPARVTELINKTMSFFTSAISYNRLVSEAQRAIRLEWVNQIDFIIIFVSSLISVLAIIATLVGSTLQIGNTKFKNLANRVTLIGSSLQILGLIGIYISYVKISGSKNLERVMPRFSQGFYIFLILAVLVLILSVILLILVPKSSKEERYEMSGGNQLLLMFLPFAALIFVFSYLPLTGWRYAFYDYQVGGQLNADNFVGFRWFTFLFQNESMRNDMFRVLGNTLAMSGLGLLTSWLPMFFAMFLVEITSTKFKKFVQIFSTIPNFISWVIVYSIALAMFSTDGFVNGIFGGNKNYLMDGSFTWVKMWAWGMWKGIGWSAIIYIASISSIDPAMYESASIDGATRFQKMRYITLPSLMPTFFVLLIMSVANILSNGMDQYLVFQNAINTGKMEVLDLYVYQLGIASKNPNIALSTVVGMLKSLISIILLFSVNKASKVIRKESII
ncbi:ABC transporter permease subunit [Haploplasma axanthum]|uniref:Inner membrane ABC transporter permease protein ycjO n=1 Tax=Haploplasma axanthum TaxID=29552 RepID=A0A449BFB4_HAPAX|nr:ABC transporter permease subunit [Haploplasma axanthum]VEU81118.1 Inner membrane ABC transporter permease protein ycjO [Haploplasma axanthum]